MVHGFTKQDHIELLGREVAEEIRARKAVLAGAAIFIAALPRLSQRCLGYIHAHIGCVRVNRQLVRGIARSASEIENAAALQVFFQVRIYAVARRVVDEVPMSPGKFLIPKDHLDLGRAIPFDKTPHNFYRSSHNVNVLLSVQLSTAPSDSARRWAGRRLNVSFVFSRPAIADLDAPRPTTFEIPFERLCHIDFGRPTELSLELAVTVPGSFPVPVPQSAIKNRLELSFGPGRIPFP